MKYAFSYGVIASTLLYAASVPAQSFHRIASFGTYQQFQEPHLPSSAEIVTATEDGNTLIYTDAYRKGLGIIDIRDPHTPTPKGFISLQGEPTSVTYADNRLFTVINTSSSYTKPSGVLQSYQLDNQALLQTCSLSGQPDAIAISPDRRWLAIAIENERNEAHNDGLLPQYPAGDLTLIPLKKGTLLCDQQKRIDLTGLAQISPSDPEPEFVDFNEKNEVVITLQENNHLVIVNAETDKIVNHFSAGSVDLQGADTQEEGALTFNGQLKQLKREPDAVKWLDNDRFVTANEGDYQGGSRGFTIYHKDGRVLYESYLDLEYRAAQAGHYPEKRSANKGIEPEGIAIGQFGDTKYIFVLAERAGVIGVYRDTGKAPEFMQLLPSGIGPESGIALPQRNLFVSANEKDNVKKNGVRAHVMLYKLTDQAPNYPQLIANMSGNIPIGWGTLSGLTADPKHEHRLYGVSDGFYQTQQAIFVINAANKPAIIEKRIVVQSDEKLDLEGITHDGKTGFYLISKGNSKKSVPHQILHVDQKGQIQQRIPFPNTQFPQQTPFGGEGIAKNGDQLWVALQQPWQDDPTHTVKLLNYDLTQKMWQAVRYPLNTNQQGQSLVSDLSQFGDHLYVLERDNQTGENAAISGISRIALADLTPMPLDQALPLVEKQWVHNLQPDLRQAKDITSGKIEGFTITPTGTAFVVTDNDGLDDSTGETQFFSIGKIAQ